MCVACKVIINEQNRAIASSLEKILAMPDVIEKLGDVEATSLRQRLADSDIASYMGIPGPSGGYVAIIARLVERDVLNAAIWEILRHPDDERPIAATHGRRKKD